ncbi:MAG: hypothetical protein WAW72_03185 [Trichococcus flocculiformis]
MKIYHYKHYEDTITLTTELSDFEMVMNGLVLVDSSDAAEGYKIYLAEIEGHLNRILKILPGTTKQYQLYKLVAILEEMAKEDGFDLGWEHKKTTPHRE